MTWMTPLVQTMSVLTTLALLAITFLPSTSILIGAPWTDIAILPSIFMTSAAIALELMTWYFRIEASLALFSGLRSISTVPSGSLANASSVGARTVNGPSPLRTSTRSAALSAATRVLNDPAATAVSTMSFSAAKAGEARATRAKAAKNRRMGKAP